MELVAEMLFLPENIFKDCIRRKPEQHCISSCSENMSCRTLGVTFKAGGFVVYSSYLDTATVT